MATYQRLKNRLDAREVVILDGAIGTELQRMGVPMHHNAWCAVAMETHPDSVRQLHEDYIRAGAEVITTNTFSSARHVLEAAGVPEKTAAWNRRAVELASEARDQAAGDREVYIAGAISRYDVPSGIAPAALKANYEEQAGLLAEAGADLMLLEMLGGPVEHAVSALEAAVGTGLPTWVALSYTVGTQPSPQPVSAEAASEARPLARFDQQAWGDAIKRIMGVGGSALLLIHSPVQVVDAALGVMKKSWKGPLGAYPHSGHWVRPNWQFVNMISPAEYLAEAKRWVQETGAQIIGGCCGIGMQHIEKLRPGLPAKVPGRR